MPTAYPIIILTLLASGVGLIILANMMFYAILAETNRSLPPDQRISTVGVNVKYGRVLQMHAQLFPESKKRRRMKLLGFGGFLLGGIAFLVDVVHYGQW